MRSWTVRKRLITLLTLVVLLVALVPVALAWPFGDVPSGHWAYNAIRRIAYLNITSGCGGGNFCPGDYVTRAQMAGFMDNLTKAHTTQAEPFILNLNHSYSSGDHPAIISKSESGNAVHAESYGAGVADNGVYGYTNSSDGSEAGVSGRSSGAASGVRGITTGGNYGVYGAATLTTGTRYGVFGRAYSPSGRGVYGFASSTTGQNIGVMGYTNSLTFGYGVVGQQAGSPSGHGAYYVPGGFFSGRNGVIGTTSYYNGAAVVGLTQDASAYAGLFTGSGHGVIIDTDAGKVGLVVYDGSKSAAVSTNEGDRLLYTEEATEVWFADYGSGQLQDGAAVIAIDPLYAQTVNLNVPYHVYLTPVSAEPVLLFVADKTPTAFEVRGVTLDGQPAAASFDYRIVGKRLGFEDARLERLDDLPSQNGTSEPIVPDTSPLLLESAPEGE